MENQYGGRRKKRKSVAVVAFDFGSLGLSSAVAEHAIEKVRVHTQTLDATADMSTEEALKLHEGVVSLVLEEITFLFGRRLNFCRQFDVSSKNCELRYLRLI